MRMVQYEIIHFSGHVQGVGFRYATRQVAQEFEVTGFVENLTDGRVVVEVTGTAGEIDAFLAAVQERMHGYVRQVERRRGTESVAFTGFEIR